MSEEGTSTKMQMRSIALPNLLQANLDRTNLITGLRTNRRTVECQRLTIIHTRMEQEGNGREHGLQINRPHGLHFITSSYSLEVLQAEFALRAAEAVGRSRAEGESPRVPSSIFA